MDRRQQTQDEVERIMRRAEEAGLDPRRVALARNHRPGEEVALQETARTEPRRSGFAARLLRRREG